MTQIASSGQTFTISSGQTSQGIIVLTGGLLQILSGGTAVSGDVGGEDDVSSGGVVSAMTIFSGFEGVSAGGTAISTTLLQHAEQDVAGRTVFTVVSFGSVEDIFSGGTASFTTLSGGTDNIFGGTATGTIVS